MRKEIIQAIKNFDSNELDTLLDDEKPYMDVSKSLFLKTLEKKFESAKDDGCHSFDDVFFGICESCNKGCEGITFLSESGYYLDLFIESREDDAVEDIYVCNKLTNFTNLDKTMDLAFSFYKDEKVAFKPSTGYTLIKQHHSLLISDLKNIKDKIKLDDFLKWYDGFDYLRSVIHRFDPFVCFDYKLYSKVFNLTCQIDKIGDIQSKSEYVTEALINYQFATSEREKLIWFYENQQNHYGTIYFEFPKNWKANSCVVFKTENIELTINISNYEYVMDYFTKLDNLYDDLMKKYKPLPKHFEESETGSVEYSLENHLRIHNKHLDVLEMFNRKNIS